MLVDECLVYEQVRVRDGPDGSPADPEVGVVVHLIDAVLAPDAVPVGVPPVGSGSGVVVVGEIDVAGGVWLGRGAFYIEHYVPACDPVVIADDEDVLDALGATVRQEGSYLLQKIVGAVLGLDPGHVDDPGRNALGRLPVGQPLHGPDVVLMGDDHVLAVGQLVGLDDAGAGVRYRLGVDHHGAHDVHRAPLALIGTAQDRAGLLGVHDVQRYREGGQGLDTAADGVPADGIDVEGGDRYPEDGAGPLQLGGLERELDVVAVYVSVEHDRPCFVLDRERQGGAVGHDLEPATHRRVCGLDHGQAAGDGSRGEGDLDRKHRQGGQSLSVDYGRSVVGDSGIGSHCVHVDGRGVERDAHEHPVRRCGAGQCQNSEHAERDFHRFLPRSFPVTISQYPAAVRASITNPAAAASSSGAMHLESRSPPGP
ncbi:MAG: hypothetical protein BWX47_01034 [candidate division Hyd24-12 bacterium ADurb.Bin004]|nr:MAG: hypothetical protein BWX47_01034 [candidate division Hyd24-12 bacterium ADurb.Bin004]